MHPRRPISLTSAPVRVTAAGAQGLRVAREVLDSQELKLVLRLLGMEGSGRVGITIETGTQIETENGWVQVGAFSNVDTVGATTQLTVTGLLRYVRYNVTLLQPTSATFAIDGMAMLSKCTRRAMAAVPRRLVGAQAESKRPPPGTHAVDTGCGCDGAKSCGCSDTGDRTDGASNPKPADSRASRADVPRYGREPGTAEMHALAAASEVVTLSRRPIALTEVPIVVTGTGAQELRLVRDVLDVRHLELVLRVLALSGAGQGITVAIETGMQAESETGWVSVGSFTAQTSAPGYEKRSFSGLLRYVRYNVTGFFGTSATFTIDGMATLAKPKVAPAGMTGALTARLPGVDWTTFPGLDTLAAALGRPGSRAITLAAQPVSRVAAVSGSAPGFVPSGAVPVLGLAGSSLSTGLPSLYATGGGGGPSGGFGPSGQAPPATPSASQTPSPYSLAPEGEEPPLMSVDEWACAVADCQPPLECCPQGMLKAICADLQSDEANCGECGRECAPSQVCDSGQCVGHYPLGQVILIGQHNFASRLIGGAETFALTIDDLYPPSYDVGSGSQSLLYVFPTQDTPRMEIVGFDLAYALPILDPHPEPCPFGDYCPLNFPYPIVNYVSVLPNSLKPFFPQPEATYTAIQHVMRYNHGACSFKIPMNAFLGEITQRMWTEAIVPEVAKLPIAATVRRLFDFAEPFFVSTSTHIRHGFTILAVYEFDALGFGMQVEINPAYELSVRPSDGLLQVTNIQKHVIVINNMFDVKDKIMRGLAPVEGEPLTGMTLQEQLEQQVEDLATRLFGELPDQVIPCDDTQNVAAQQKECFNTLKLPWVRQSLSDFIVNRLQGALGWLDEPTARAYAELALSALQERNFSCRDNLCHFHPVFKRINVLPDEIEFVLADQPQFNPPGEAGLVMLYDILPVLFPGEPDLDTCYQPIGRNDGQVATAFHGFTEIDFDVHGVIGEG